MLQNLLCLWKKKTHVHVGFFVFISSNFHFPLTNALVYVNIDQGIYKGKMKVALNEKRKKLHGFSFSINIANFEAFLSVFKLTKNPLFLKSEVLDKKPLKNRCSVKMIIKRILSLSLSRFVFIGRSTRDTLNDVKHSRCLHMILHSDYCI